MGIDPTPSQRTDADALLALIAETVKESNVEPGYKTTEFALAVVTLAADFVLPGLSPQERMSGAVIVAGAYGAFRTWRKRGGPAALVAELAKLRVAIFGGRAPAPLT
jgi:hypothetical protein